MASISTFIIQYKTRGLGSLIRSRSALNDLTRTGTRTFNSLSNSVFNYERNTKTAFQRITRHTTDISKTFAKLSLVTAAFGTGGFVSLFNEVNNSVIKTNAGLQASKILFSELLGTQSRADSFVSSINQLAIKLGLDLPEALGGSRSILQMFKQISPQQNFGTGELEKIVKLASTLQQLDIEKKPLKHYLYSFREILEGNGSVSFKSLRSRLEVNLGRTKEAMLTNLIKKGDIKGFVTSLDQAFKDIGINSDRLTERFLSGSFSTNISRLGGMISLVKQRIGEPLFNVLTDPLVRFNNFFSENLMQGSTGSNIINQLGNDILTGLQPTFTFLSAFTGELYTFRHSFVNNFINSIKSNFSMFKSFSELFTSFYGGLFNIKSFTGKGFIELLEKSSKFADRLRAVFTELHTPLRNLGSAIHNIVSELSKFLSGSGGLLLNLTKAGLNFTTAGLNLLASPVNTVNDIIGNSKPPEQRNTAQNIAGSLLPIIGSTLLISMLTRRKPIMASNNVLPGSSSGTRSTGLSSVPGLKHDPSKTTPLQSLPGNMSLQSSIISKQQQLQQLGYTGSLSSMHQQLLQQKRGLEFSIQQNSTRDPKMHTISQKKELEQVNKQITETSLLREQAIGAGINIGSLALGTVAGNAITNKLGRFTDVLKQSGNKFTGILNGINTRFLALNPVLVGVTTAIGLFTGGLWLANKAIASYTATKKLENQASINTSIAKTDQTILKRFDLLTRSKGIDLNKANRYFASSFGGSALTPDKFPFVYQMLGDPQKKQMQGLFSLYNEAKSILPPNLINTFFDKDTRAVLDNFQGTLSITNEKMSDSYKKQLREEIRTALKDLVSTGQTTKTYTFKELNKMSESQRLEAATSALTAGSSQGINEYYNPRQ